jgi:gamma-glutamyltranspeptidase/glutathione hydrolase
MHLRIESYCTEFAGKMEFMGSRRSPVLSTGGCCASNEPVASAIGVKILQRGGTAADACVAMAAALGVLQPCMSGLGGDSFALFFDAAAKEVHCLQGRKRYPPCPSLPPASLPLTASLLH